MDDLGLVGVGASAGGVEALMALVVGLDPHMPAAVLVVVHQAADGPSVLAGILDRRTPLDVAEARDGELLTAGRVLVAPPDVHLRVDDGRVLLGHEPKEDGHRPGIDALFRSLARAGGRRAVGVVLSGLLDDGAAGLLDIVRHGGGAVVQDPQEAMYDSMPAAALARVPGATVRRAGEIGPALRELVDRRRVGHGWSAAAPAVERDDATEQALYAALRALEDKATLSRRVADSAETAGAAHVAERSRDAAREALRSARVLRGLLGEEPGRGETDPTT